MALQPCPECQHQVSESAQACPQCGHPIAEKQAEKEETEAPRSKGGCFTFLAGIVGVLALLLLALSQCQDSTNSTSSLATRTPQKSGVTSSDLRQAETFADNLPSACNKQIRQDSDGTVTVIYDCYKDGKSMSGAVAIKNGVVTNLK